jgi:sporulation integral membrane protein YtvI
MNGNYETRKRFIVNVLYFALTAALLYVSVKYVLGWLLPFIIGFVVSLLLRPAIRFLSKKLRLPYKAVAVVLSLLFYAVVIVLLTLLGAKIVLVLKDGFARLPDIYDHQIQPLLSDLFMRLQDLTARLDPNMVQLIENMTSSITDSAGSLVTGISKTVSSTIISLPGVLLATLLSVISTVFFAMDFSFITGYAVGLLPEKIQGYVLQLKRIGKDIGKKYVKSYALLLMITFAELALGLTIIGVRNAIAVAALIAFIDLLPVLGTGAVVIPWIIIKLAQGNIPFAIGLAVLYGVIVVVRNVLEPRIVGRQIGVHPLAMLIGMYVGLRLFGFIGIFVLPILLVVTKGFIDSRKAGDGAGGNTDGNTGLSAQS